jgi:oligosaccharide repeat unit polymerase
MTLIMCAAGAGLSLTGLDIAGFVAAAIASLGLIIFAVRSSAGYASVTVIFVVFFLAYGVLAPAGAFAGLRIFFPPPYETGQFVAHYCLACAGLMLGLSEERRPETHAVPFVATENLNPAAILVVAFVCAGAATSFEVINVIRAGGPEILLGGKLAYQSAITELTATLPAEYAARMAVALFALWFALSRGAFAPMSIRKLLVFFVLIAPVLMVFIVLGRRTEILALLLSAIVAGTYLTPLRRLTPQVVVAVALVYLFFIVIFVLRETVFHRFGGHMSTGHFTAAILHALFPASGEFGAPFSVFSEGIKRFGDNALLWGGSYLDGVALVVPSFLYPGDKPIQLDTALFAVVNPGGTSHLGSSAGFGYSPILEALLNFGKLGVFLMFLLVGSCLKWIDRLRLRCGAFAFVLFYLLLLPIGQTFHRSTFGNAILSPGLWIVISVVGATIIYKISARFIGPGTARQS